MKTINAELKALVQDLIFFEDDLDANGQRMIRRQFPKTIFRGMMTLRKKINDSMEVGVVEKDKFIDGVFKVEDVKWLKPLEVTESLKIVQERHTAADIEFTEAELAVMKFCYEAREEIPGVSIETLEEFEGMIGKKAA